MKATATRAKIIREIMAGTSPIKTVRRPEDCSPIALQRSWVDGLKICKPESAASWLDVPNLPTATAKQREKMLEREIKRLWRHEGLTPGEVAA